MFGDGEQQLEKDVWKCEVVRWEFHGRFEGRNQLGVLGRRRNPSLFPLGQAIPRPQTRATGPSSSLSLLWFNAEFLNCDNWTVIAFQERAALAAAAAASDPYRYVEKRKPIPDPQVSITILFVLDLSLCLYVCIDFQFWFHGFQETGLVYGNKNRSNKSED